MRSTGPGDRATVQRHPGKGERAFPKFEVPEGHSRTRTSNMSRGWIREAAPAPRSDAGQGALKHHVEEYAERLDREIQMIEKMKFSDIS